MDCHIGIQELHRSWPTFDCDPLKAALAVGQLAAGSESSLEAELYEHMVVLTGGSRW